MNLNFLFFNHFIEKGLTYKKLYIVNVYTTLVELEFSEVEIMV